MGCGLIPQACWDGILSCKCHSAPYWGLYPAGGCQLQGVFLTQADSNSHSHQTLIATESSERSLGIVTSCTPNNSFSVSSSTSESKGGLGHRYQDLVPQHHSLAA